MKIAAVCCTYLRPTQLGHLIRCFQLQDYADRELVILDDAGQYESTEGDRWRLISTARRWPTLGDKRNAAARLVSPDVEALAVWDDDDLYLPWALSASVAALEQAPWSRPSRVLHRQADGTLRQHETGGLYHGGWAYQRDAFWNAGGYPSQNNGEDQELARRISRRRIPEADPIMLGFLPFYIYQWGGPGYHISALGDSGYDRLGLAPRRKTPVAPADPPHVDLWNPRIDGEVYPRVF
jgi:glycosyltransferase involved in cell wall biosynthesis